MANTTEEVHRRSLYDSPSSKTARAKDEGRGTKPNPVGALRTIHRELQLGDASRHGNGCFHAEASSRLKIAMVAPCGPHQGTNKRHG
jgi:hypothetical protein